MASSKEPTNSTKSVSLATYQHIEKNCWLPNLGEEVKKIRKSVIKTASKVMGAHICSQKGWDCDDRVCPYFESRMQCPENCGRKCHNQSIWENPRNDLVQIAFCGAFGKGLKAIKEIPEGIFLMEYVGELVKSEEFEKKVCKAGGNYGMQFDNWNSLVVDASRMGNLSRFINHRCSRANLQVQRWFSRKGMPHLIFVTTKTIKRGEQLFYDYESDYFLHDECRCYSSNCRTLKKRAKTAQDETWWETKEVPYLPVNGKSKMAFYGQFVVSVQNGAQKYAYGCGLCPPAQQSHYATMASVVRHIMNIHAQGSPPYLCGTCGKGFYRSDNRKKHALTHKSEKEREYYYCESCDKKFTTPSFLAKHDFVKHQNGYFFCEEKIKPGEICGKKFGSRSSVKYHIETVCHLP